MLPFTVRLELCIPNAATRTEPALTVTSPVTTAGPAGTAHSPFTTTLELIVPTSTPGDESEPLQVTVPLTVAPAAVTGPAASSPPITAPVNTRQDRPRRYPLMTQFLPFRAGSIAEWLAHSNRARRPGASPAAEAGRGYDGRGASPRGPGLADDLARAGQRQGQQRRGSTHLDQGTEDVSGQAAQAPHRDAAQQCGREQSGQDGGGGAQRRRWTRHHGRRPGGYRQHS